MATSTAWDYVIVGGGIAGCVVASRLSEYKPSSRILVIEAGADVSHDEEILKFQSLNFIGGKFDWAYKTVPQKHYGGREIDIPAGRALGGGSVINGCGWIRGARADFDSWAEIVDDHRWSYEGQLPYFKKTEKWYKSDNRDDHGHIGAMHIESPKSTGRIYPLADITQKSWSDIGVQELPGCDMNAGENIGLGELNENRHKGARQTAPLAYPLKNVNVLPHTLVESIIIEKSPEVKATGVRLDDGAEIFAKEVIISAGAYRTPQVLMLSGIGPKETLQKHGIETKVDNPEVGKNFNDHVMVHFNWQLKDPSKGYAVGSANSLFAKPEFATGMPISFIINREVPKDGLIAAITKDEGKAPGPDHYLLKRRWGLMENIILYLSMPPHPVDGTHISNAMMGAKPTSRGTVSIASKNPADAPVLDPNYCATEVDRYVWRESIRETAALMMGDTPLGREVVAGETPSDGSEPLKIGSSDEYLDSRVRSLGRSTYHGSSSCSMGTVVDTDLRVKGVKNLRIVDASVFPISIGAHIQAAVYALAEQAAVIISQDQ
ncbi:GMC oxidoreductase [Annulohypoxylon maeteangense]|uniref:GMC oxidoreductase n=1 Tax=Annulohypoxylon maeteangense TaxID=1927788 RepID=UPI002007438A|nr:GMC oxidoreductase [Annulohypoxylon maeteangense]KAI0881338.1 GMC oxidoreductase [Annulohypoxylon maeteangense]